MTFYSAKAQAVLKRHPVILATSSGLILPRTDFNSSYLEPGDGLTETEFVDLLLGMHPIRTLNMYSLDFDCISPKNLMWLDGMGVFSELEHWYIGWNGHLTVRGMFGLLSIMPNLKGLHIGNVSGSHDAEDIDRAAPGPHDDAENGGRGSSNNDEDAEPGSNKNADNARNTDDASPKDLTSDPTGDSSSSSDAKSTTSSGLNHWNPIPDLATPACALTHLVVSDDWGIDFMEYDALLSQSHNSLTHVEGHWIYESEPGDQLAIALKKCKRVQSLTVIGCSFDNEKLIKACPRLRRLEVENMRGEFRSAWEFLLKAEAEELPMSPCGHLQSPESGEIEDVPGETNEVCIHLQNREAALTSLRSRRVLFLPLA